METSLFNNFFLFTCHLIFLIQKSSPVKKEYIFSERYMYKQFYAQATVTEYIEFSATTNKMHFL